MHISCATHFSIQLLQAISLLNTLYNPPNRSTTLHNMSRDGATNVDGVGTLTYQRAIDIARNTEGELDRSVKAYLDKAIVDIWNRINQSPDTYVLSRDEFAVFNYYIRRFDGSPVAERAVDRYWRITGLGTSRR